MRKLMSMLALLLTCSASYADVAPIEEEELLLHQNEVAEVADDVAAQHRFNTVDITQALIQPFEQTGGQGVSGAFAGMTAKGLLMAGGCNFPYSPAAENGRKEFYSGIFFNAAPDGDGQWTQVGTLPCVLAYGQSVTVPEGVVCLGGTADGSKSEDFAVLYSMNGNQLQTRQLPSLPTSLDNFGAAYGDGYIYIAGGQHDGEINLKAYRLAWPAAQAWEELPDMPAPGRVQPAAVVQRANIGPNFYLLGGYNSRYARRWPTASISIPVPASGRPPR